MEEVNVLEAHEELMYKLFGSDISEIDNYRELKVSRSKYTEAMHKVQDEYGLKQGHPKFVEWLFTCIGRSPMIVEDEEKGADENE